MHGITCIIRARKLSEDNRRTRKSKMEDGDMEVGSREWEGGGGDGDGTREEERGRKGKWEE